MFSLHGVNMRILVTIALLVATPAVASAQTADVASAPRPRAFTLLGGFGNAMGWLGLQGEKYLGHEVFSVFGGLGYTPAVNAGDASGVTVAAGGRLYTPGRKHRGFLELSVSQLAVGQFCFDRCSRWYGPGLQAGYQFVTQGGFTLLASLGLGYAPGMRDGRSKVGGMGGLGLGYTWHR